MDAFLDLVLEALPVVDGSHIPRDTCPNIIALFGFYVFERELPDQKLLTETEEDGGEQEDTLAEDIVIELLFGHEAHDI